MYDSSSPWNYCLERLEKELGTQPFNTWIRPLQAEQRDTTILLLAPNRFVKDWVEKHYTQKINSFLLEKEAFHNHVVSIVIGSQEGKKEERATRNVKKNGRNNKGLNPAFTFNTFVEGKSNQFAKAASLQVAERPGTSYNPLFIYGAVGLGKTHLMQAVGHTIAEQGKGDKNIAYLNSEQFVSEMVKALRHNTIDKFKKYYRSVDALLIDDIQFFAGKGQTQEEFFHTFNSLVEKKHQIILTCDRYPNKVDGLEKRLASRFGSGLTVEVQPPEFETRVAIIKSKAAAKNIQLPNDVSFFIAKRFHSNVRELEGALNRVIANANLLAQENITLSLAEETLRDLLLLQDNQITIENIQKTVVEYFNIRLADLLSNKRSRSIVRPRQLAMKLAKELTNYSLPEIGNAFGGRDHSTVLHACRKIDELRKTENVISEDYKNLFRTLTV